MVRRLPRFFSLSYLVTAAFTSFVIIDFPINYLSSFLAFLQVAAQRMLSGYNYPTERMKEKVC